VSRGSTYGPADYDAMFADPVRTPAYLDAIARTIRQGDIVVEIGTGVGYFAVAACRAGAQRVYAIEREPSVALAEALANENGFGDRIVCIRHDASRVTLPERGTVLISDLRGALPLFGDAIPTLVSARNRLLVPGARLIPQRDVIRAAPCAAPPQWRKVELSLGANFAQVNRKALAAFARSQVHGDSLSGSLLCAPPADVATLDYGEIITPDVDAHLSWIVARSATVAGIGAWFDAELAEGVRFSTAPDGPPTVYGHSFFPLDCAVDVAPGDRVECHLRARLVDGAYLFAWDTEIRVAGQAEPVRMQQSTLGSVLATVAELATRRDSYRPQPERFGVVPELVSLVDGKRTLAEIAEALVVAHPDRFQSAKQALGWVTDACAELARLVQ